MQATPEDAPSLASAPAGETSPLSELQGEHRAHHEMRATAEEEASSPDASSDEEMRPGAVAVAGMFKGPTGPSVLSETSSNIAWIFGKAVTSTAIVETSSPFARGKDY